MAWPLKKTEDNRSGKTSLLALAGWGLVATMSFVLAFMALQFSEFKDSTTVAFSARDSTPEYTGSINARPGPKVGIIQRGAATGKPTRTQELSTEVDLLRKELIALRRIVSSIRESRNDLAERVAIMEKAAQGIASGANSRRAQPSRIPADPLPLTGMETRPAMPPIPPIPKAMPPSKKVAAKKAKAQKTAHGKNKSNDAAPKRAVTKIRKVDDPALTTASIPKKTEDKEGVSAEKTSFGVDLGGFSTLATLNKGWSDLKSDQKPLLADLAPRAILSDKNGRLEVRLVAGPFSNAAHAITLCAQLQARGRSCQPSLFVGQPVVTQ